MPLYIYIYILMINIIVYTYKYIFQKSIKIHRFQSAMPMPAAAQQEHPSAAPVALRPA